MKKAVEFTVSKGIDGYYVAMASDFPIFTQAKSLDDLVVNIQEATELHFRDEKVHQDEGSIRYPVSMSFELPYNVKT